MGFIREPKTELNFGFYTKNTLNLRWAFFEIWEIYVFL